MDERGERYRSRGRIPIFVVNRRWARTARLVATSRAFQPLLPAELPLGGRRQDDLIRAARAIGPGEELTYDYATAGDHDIMCRRWPVSDGS